jgi:hypothetical protein
MIVASAIASAALSLAAPAPATLPGDLDAAALSTNVPACSTEIGYGSCQAAYSVRRRSRTPWKVDRAK